MKTNEPIEDSLLENMINYLKTSFELAKFKGVNKVTELLVALISVIILGIIFLPFFLLLNIGLSLLIGKLIGEYYYGFFIVSGFYLIIVILLYFFRVKLLETPISNLILKLLLSNSDIDKIRNSDYNEKKTNNSNI